MSHKVRLSQEARHDIKQAYLYIRQDSPDRARRWRQRLLASIRTLRRFPERHAVFYQAGPTNREIRQMLFGVYRILYTIDRDLIHVVTVRHGARRPIDPADLPQSK